MRSEEGVVISGSGKDSSNKYLEEEMYTTFL